MCRYVVPAIKQKWPDQNRSITIQQDGASAHVSDDDFEFKSHAQTGLWNIKLLTQLAKSPDLNVLDLSFFRALQSAQWEKGFETTIDGLVDQVLRAYADFVPRKIDKGFLTLMGCMDKIMKFMEQTITKFHTLERRHCCLSMEGYLTNERAAIKLLKCISL